MKHFVLAIAIVAMTSLPSVARAALEDVVVSLEGSAFYWEEYSGGRRLLRESGPLGGIGCSVSYATTASGADVVFRGRLGFFGGEVGYDGQTIGQQPLPVKTDTVYLGAEGRGDVGVRLPVGGATVEPFGGISYRWWRRDIQSSTTVDAGGPVAVGGALEIWQSLAARGGVRAAYPVTPTTAVVAEAGALYPFYNRNNARDLSLGEPTLEPKGDWSAFAELGLTYGSFRPSIYYQGLRFSRSPAIPVGQNIVVFQPESTEDQVGIRLGWAFH